MDFLLSIEAKDIILTNTMELVHLVVTKKCLTNDILSYDLLLKRFLVCGKENEEF